VAAEVRVGYIDAMSSLTISIPPALQSWVDRRLEAGEFTDAAEYLRDLIRRDRIALAARERLREQIEEGLASPLLDQDAFEVIDAIIAEDPDLRACA
jgi:antitoxin ParD1/3/4